MDRSKLDLDSLDVASFEVNPQPGMEPIDGFNGLMAGPGGYCCTGCVSGCGYNPTASGCASGGDPTY
ncbi:MAG TPA: hypothetical protein VGO40_12315 [Longimicrobium sp.]|jgi:hypothetical protein|nr:hypothetical protein [Longimicrobium sp.]